MLNSLWHANEIVEREQNIKESQKKITFRRNKCGRKTAKKGGDTNSFELNSISIHFQFVDSY